ncbi:hypothetical protein MLD38_026801 [Melastoma candidum]|uniref:Uncharacterized protein n=1 Tax=Melastoma candidum TaxID=119954 RepID=A0ACB9NZQ4_9MYRT|nr:hypothetical protein MLD38_026801 [Melastoma candidum]
MSNKRGKLVPIGGACETATSSVPPMDAAADLSSGDTLTFARCYQLEAFEFSRRQNTIVFLETGTGKTLIAIMLLRSYAHLIRKPSAGIAVFLVPQVVLVSQQADVIRSHTDLRVGMYWGDMQIDFWDIHIWRGECEKFEVLVMTPAILLNCLRHSFFSLEMIKLLIFDECHHTRGNHPYACIMKEFYHRQHSVDGSKVPRILGMTASPIKSKCGHSESEYWQKIQELEKIMNAKLFPKLKDQMRTSKEKHMVKMEQSDLAKYAIESTSKKISKILSAFEHCVDELGVWPAMKAAYLVSSHEVDDLSWGKLDLLGENIVREFSEDIIKVLSDCIPADPSCSILKNMDKLTTDGFISSKVACLFNSLMEYRLQENIRCIIFVERIITAHAVHCFLNELLPRHSQWKTNYLTGNSSRLQSQTRKQQNELVEAFRKGEVNVIVATSILEEGLDVQSCNLVIRFDPSATVCSFIQSRGRARMRCSDYLLMVARDDIKTYERLLKFLDSGDIMKKQSMDHASTPCPPLEEDSYSRIFYCVESTGALLTLSSCVSLINLYCSRLPSDGYFKPTPRFIVNDDSNDCTLYFPKSCLLPSVSISLASVEGRSKMAKQLVCFEACKQLHRIGALTDNLVPDIVMEEKDDKLFGSDSYDEEQPSFFPHEFVNYLSSNSKTTYCCYVLELSPNFKYDVSLQNILLGLRSKMELDCSSLELDVSRGSLSVSWQYVGQIHLAGDQVNLCKRFQYSLLSVLLDHNTGNLTENLNCFNSLSDLHIDYLLLPTLSQQPSKIDWRTVASVTFRDYNKISHVNSSCSMADVNTRNSRVCCCLLRNSLVCTPHNGYVYCVDGTLGHLNATSYLTMNDGTTTTYLKYYAKRYDIQLCFKEAALLNCRRLFHIQNSQRLYMLPKKKESTSAFVELPPELCYILYAPISLNTVYTFTFVPLIMHRIESLLIAASLKQIHLDHFAKHVDIPTTKVLEALTTKRCGERFHLESLENLGDSFLKYAVSQQLFKTYQTNHEGLLSIKREKLVNNASLCQMGCSCKLTGFIRNNPFEPSKWILPGVMPKDSSLYEELASETRKMYVQGKRMVKMKTVADVVEALLGAYVSSGGEMAGLMLMDWLGIKAVESLLRYSFRDPSLLVEALTHGSYMLPEIPKCYQRLEFLGDSVLDFLVTLYLHDTHPGLSPGVLTDMRSASVNNDSYAQSALKAGLHKHILHASHTLHQDIAEAIAQFEKLPTSEFTYGWDSDTSFPKVLGDVIESLAGAILVDTGYNKDRVFQSIKPLLEPLITPETVRLHPKRELSELCQKQGYNLRKPISSRKNGLASVTVEVEAKGKIFSHTAENIDKNAAKRLAAKEVLRLLKKEDTDI